MKISIKKSLRGLLLAPMVALAVSAVVPVLQPTEVGAQSTGARSVQRENNFQGGVRGGADAAGQGANQQSGKTIPEMIVQIINILLYIIGAVAVIMIIFGGFKYVTSGGDSSGVSSAKNTILYAIIGLVVAVLAWAIVNFVLLNLLGI